MAGIGSCCIKKLYITNWWIWYNQQPRDVDENGLYDYNQETAGEDASVGMDMDDGNTPIVADFNTDDGESNETEDLYSNNGEEMITIGDVMEVPEDAVWWKAVQNLDNK